MTLIMLTIIIIIIIIGGGVIKQYEIWFLWYKFANVTPLFKLRCSPLVFKKYCVILAKNSLTCPWDSSAIKLIMHLASLRIQYTSIYKRSCGYHMEYYIDVVGGQTPTVNPTGLIETRMPYLSVPIIHFHGFIFT